MKNSERVAPPPSETPTLACTCVVWLSVMAWMMNYTIGCVNRNKDTCGEANQLNPSASIQNIENCANAMQCQSLFQRPSCNCRHRSSGPSPSCFWLSFILLMAFSTFSLYFRSILRIAKQFWCWKCQLRCIKPPPDIKSFAKNGCTRCHPLLGWQTALANL